jgi:uncharacterized protein DUF4145
MTWWRKAHVPGLRGAAAAGRRRWREVVAFGVFIALLVLGMLFLVVPALGRDADMIAGAPIGMTNTTVSVMTTTTHFGADPPAITRVETVERSPYVDGGLLGVALAIPGMLFFLRLGVFLLVAMIGAAVAQAIMHARFDVNLGSFRVGAPSSVRVAQTFQNAAHALSEAVEKKVEERPQPTARTGTATYQMAVAANVAQATVAAERQARRKRYESVQDPDLAIAALRVDLEQSLRVLAEHSGIDRKSVGEVISELRHHGVITSDLARLISRLLEYGNQAAHGVRFPSSTLEMIRYSALDIFDKLDELTELSRPVRDTPQDAGG